MTDNQGGEAATVETTAADTPRDYEAEARKQGWRPKEEWSGKPDNWKDAQTYVERGEEIATHTSRAVKEVEARYEERFKKLEKVTSKTIEAVQRDAEERIAALTAERREAIKAGDVDKVEKIDAKIDKAKEDVADDKPTKLTGAALDKHNERVQKEWVAKQDWWDKDEDMTEFAIGRSQTIAGKNPDISIEDNIAQVEEALRKKFPDKFGGKTGANGHAPVDGGGSFPGAGGNKKDPLANLPAEAKAQAKSDMAKFPKVYPTAESWLKAYNS